MRCQYRPRLRGTAIYADEMSAKKVLIGGSMAAVVAIAAVFIFLNFFRDDAPEEFELRSAEEVAASATSDTEGDPPQDGEEDGEEETVDTEPESADQATEEPATADDGSGVAGTWTVGPQSVAGYRVVEDFASGLQNFEAVGRTDQIDGFLTIEGTTVTAASFDVDIASITSDSGTRDSQFSGRIMNAAEFPTAKFVLTSPIELPEIPGDTTPISVEATGDLTLRGVTNPVDVAINAQVVGGEIEVVGNVEVLFADFGIANPSFTAVAVRDEGKVEFQLIFVR